MMTMYVVIDVELGRVFGAYDSQEAALTFVARLLKTNGPSYADDLEIARQTDDGEFVDALSGAGLLARVEEMRERDRAAARRREVVPSSGGSGYGESAAMAAKGLNK